MNYPEKTEYAPFYGGYVSLVEETDIVSVLQKQISEIQNLSASISAEKSDFRYAEGKWTIREVFGHIVDAERVFSYRALRISRNDKTPMSSFDENAYVANSNFSQVNLADLIEEFSHLRQSNVLMFKNLPDEVWLQTGKASNAEISVRALAFIMAGHVRHHANILKERYLS